MEKQLASLTQQYDGLSLENLIGGPLKAVTTANSALAQTQNDLLMETCFVKMTETIKDEHGNDVETTTYSPIMIEMNLDLAVPANSHDSGNEAEPSIKTATTKFTLPLLDLISKQ